MEKIYGVAKFKLQALLMIWKYLIIDKAKILAKALT